MALTDNILAYLKFSEGTGTTAADSVGSFTGTLTGGASWTTGKIGGGVALDGVNGYVSVASGGGLNNLQTGSIAMWVKWSGTQDAGASSFNGCVFGRQSDGSFSEHVVGLTSSNPATAKIKVGLYSTSAAVTSATSPGDGTWRHIVLVYASGAQTLYLDGASDGTGTATGTISNNAAIVLALGAWIGQGGAYSTAVIDEYAAWSRVLTAPEVTQLYNGGAGLQYPFPTSSDVGSFIDSSILRPSHFREHVASDHTKARQ